jgi:very-short-patch-repair endonuclease
VFIDGPPHDYEEARRRDEEVDRKLRSLGWSVLRFRHDDDWPRLLTARPDVFGEARG